ncbi:MAG: GspH/FimT family pseudopilin [Pseudomonadales bacterium]
MMKRTEGFTLIELMVVLVVIGVGMSVAVPSFQGMIVRNRLITQTNEVILAVNLARSEASRTGSLVSIAASDASSGNEFGGGFCVVLGLPATCAGNVVRRFEAFAGTTTLNSVENVTLIQFNSLGGLVSAGPQSHSLDLCRSGYRGRRIQISIIGRVKSHIEAAPGDLNPPTIQPSC